jgi:hypothetical protein
LLKNLNIDGVAADQSNVAQVAVKQMCSMKQQTDTFEGYMQLPFLAGCP